MSGSPIPQRPVRDGEEVPLFSNNQDWLVTWHGPDSVPSGKPHGSLGICVTPEGDVVLISEHGHLWDLPAGRPEAGEDWEQTLRREMMEEACAVVRTARLLGFTRGRCIRGHEEGLVLVRAVWRADVDLQPWDPQFEIPERRVVPVGELLSHLAPGREGFQPVWRRAMVEAGLA